VRITPDRNWLGEDCFKRGNPHEFIITALEMENSLSTPGVGKNDLICYARSSQDQRIYCFSLWKANKNKLIAAFGDETDAWIGHKIMIARCITTEGKNLTEVSPI
jgi:hypothetical protein